MNFLGKKITAVSVVVVLSLFLLVSLLSITQTDMAMGADGQMSYSCLFMSSTASLCQMSALEHIAVWQGMFTAVSSQNNTLTILMLLLTLALAGTFLIRTHRSTVPPKTSISQSTFRYYKRNIFIVGPLQEAFSNGILNPKLY